MSSCNFFLTSINACKFIKWCRNLLRLDNGEIWRLHFFKRHEYKGSNAITQKYSRQLFSRHFTFCHPARVFCSRSTRMHVYGNNFNELMKGKKLRQMSLGSIATIKMFLLRTLIILFYFFILKNLVLFNFNKLAII